MVRKGDAVPYKPLVAEALGRVETKRKGLGVSVEELAERSGIRTRTLTRIRASRRAWPREVRALTMALRSIEKERAGEAALFE